MTKSCISQASSLLQFSTPPSQMAKLGVDGHKLGSTEQPRPPMHLLGSSPRAACLLHQRFGSGSREYTRSRGGGLDDNSTKSPCQTTPRGRTSAWPCSLLLSLISQYSQDKQGDMAKHCLVLQHPGVTHCPKSLLGFPPLHRDRDGGLSGGAHHSDFHRCYPHSHPPGHICRTAGCRSPSPGSGTGCQCHTRWWLTQQGGRGEGG